MCSLVSLMLIVCYLPQRTQRAQRESHKLYYFSVVSVPCGGYSFFPKLFAQVFARVIAEDRHDHAFFNLACDLERRCNICARRDADEPAFAPRERLDHRVRFFRADLDTLI